MVWQNVFAMAKWWSDTLQCVFVVSNWDSVNLNCTCIRESACVFVYFSTPVHCHFTAICLEKFSIVFDGIVWIFASDDLQLVEYISHYSNTQKITRLQHTHGNSKVTINDLRSYYFCCYCRCHRHCYVRVCAVVCIWLIFSDNIK